MLCVTNGRIFLLILYVIFCIFSYFTPHIWHSPDFFNGPRVTNSVFFLYHIIPGTRVRQLYFFLPHTKYMVFPRFFERLRLQWNKFSESHWLSNSAPIIWGWAAHQQTLLRSWYAWIVCASQTRFFFVYYTSKYHKYVICLYCFLPHTTKYMAFTRVCEWLRLQWNKCNESHWLSNSAPIIVRLSRTSTNVAKVVIYMDSLCVTNAFFIFLI